MPRLCLLRHAKSSWDDESLADRDRPLAPRGRRAAGRVAETLRERGLVPDLVLCSPALRTRQTLELVRPALPRTAEVAFEEELYGASADALLARLRTLPDTTGEVLVIGHNPGLHDLAVHLAGPGGEGDRLRERFPTAALAVLAPDGPWTELGARPARLVAFVTPGRS